MKKTLALLLLMGLVVYGCFAPGCNRNPGTQSNTNIENTTESYYVTFTVTHDAETAGTFESDVYYYNLDEKELKKIATVPYNAQYPLAIYDNSTGLVFYSSKAASGVGDQLYSFEPTTEQNTQLTESIYAINHIIPIEGGIFLGACPLAGPAIAINPLFYDWNSKSLVEWTWDQDLHFNNIFYNPDSGILVGSCYSTREDNERLAAQPDIPYTESDNRVFIIDANEGKELFETKNSDVYSLLTVGNQVLYYTERSPIWSYSIDAGTTEKYNISSIYENIGSSLLAILYISEDENEIIFLKRESANLLCYYNKENNELIEIYRANYGTEELNNAIVLPES